MQNPHAPCVPVKTQQRFSVNVWAQILGYYALGSYLLAKRLNGATHHVFPQNFLPELLQSVQATVQRGMWFMHGCALGHSSHEMHNQHDVGYPGNWNGRWGPVSWVPLSSDLNFLNHLKSVVCVVASGYSGVFLVRIFVAATCSMRRVTCCNATSDTFECVRKFVLRHCRVCNEIRVRHF